MHKLSLLAASAALLSSTIVLAQGDECTGALNVAQGANGPFSNAGSTTSAPAWPCAAGGNDVWFSYIAPGSGNLTADCCGSGYDTALEIFDGTAGCGGLVSIACNDDSCGLQSSLTVAVNVGTTYYLRVGGFGGATGGFSLNINGPAGTGTVATATNYGAGCQVSYASFYESFTPASSFDLNNSAMRLIRLNPGYVAIPVGTYLAPSANAQTLPLTDDSETTTPALATAFPYDGGTASTLTVCSNGYVSVATGNGTGYVPSVGTMLGAPQTAWWNWHDFNPSAGGAIKFEEIAGIAYITWENVRDFGGTGAGNDSTWQLQLNENDGSVTWAWQTMSALGGSTNTGYLVGYSPAGASVDPGQRDLSATLAGGFQVTTDGLGLRLAASGRPVTGTTITLDTSNVPAGATLSVVLVNFAAVIPGLELSFLGMPLCYQNISLNNAVTLAIHIGASSWSQNFGIPANPIHVGTNVFAQSAALVPGINALGAVSSNGVHLHVGNL